MVVKYFQKVEWITISTIKELIISCSIIAKGGAILYKNDIYLNLSTAKLNLQGLVLYVACLVTRDIVPDGVRTAQLLEWCRDVILKTNNPPPSLPKHEYNKSQPLTK